MSESKKVLDRKVSPVQKSTPEIIKFGQAILDEYDRLCKGEPVSKFPDFFSWFSSAPGKKGVARRKAYVETLDTISSEDSPEIAFTKLFLFYVSQKSSSRLIGLLTFNLPNLVGVKVPKIVLGPHAGNSGQVIAAMDLFLQRAEAIRDSCCRDMDDFYFPDPGDSDGSIPMVSLSRVTQ